MTPKVFIRCVAWLLIGAIAVFTLSPIEMRPVSGAPVGLERLAAFAAIGTAFCLGYPGRRFAILLLLIGAVGLLEIFQNYVPGRHGRLPDGVVKASGVLIGAMLPTLIARWKRTL
jgi:VanZ family protein